MGGKTEKCFSYDHADFYDEVVSGSDRMITFITPVEPCSECRVVDDGNNGLTGTYLLENLYNTNCNSTTTDMCSYEKDGKTYCFEEEGLYPTTFDCPREEEEVFAY